MDGDAVAREYYRISDRRYKRNIATVESGLEAIMSLRGVAYDWRQDLPDQQFGKGRTLGFTAQELETVLPELVAASSEGYKSVNYLGVIPILVEAVKSLKTQQDTALSALEAKLTAENDRLRERNAELEAKLTALAEAVRQLQAERQK